jgi:hypothetical protein
VLIFGGMPFIRGPLTSGQRSVLEHPNGRDDLERVLSVPSAVDLPAVYDAVHAVVCRHEALRTRFPAGGREQVVDGAGMLAVELCTSLEEARTALASVPFDAAGEWGIRVAVVCAGDRPRSVVLRLSRLVADMWTAELVVNDLCLLLRR